MEPSLHQRCNNLIIKILPYWEPVNEKKGYYQALIVFSNVYPILFFTMPHITQDWVFQRQLLLNLHENIQFPLVSDNNSIFNFFLNVKLVKTIIPSSFRTFRKSTAVFSENIAQYYLTVRAISKHITHNTLQMAWEYHESAWTIWIR